MAIDKVSFRLPSDLSDAVESALPTHGGKVSAVIVAALRAYLPVTGEADGQPAGGTWRESIEARLAAVESAVAAGGVKRSGRAATGPRAAVSHAGPIDPAYDEGKIWEVIESVRAQCKPHNPSGKKFTHGAVAAALDAHGLKTAQGLSWDWQNDKGEYGRVKTFINRKR